MFWLCLVGAAPAPEALLTLSDSDAEMSTQPWWQKSATL